MAPRAAAGKYKVVIEKGKEKYETTIEIAYPKNSVFTLKERKYQETVTQDLFKMNEELAYLVYEIDELVQHSDKMVKKNPKLSKAATKMSAELTALKAELVITTGDNYVGRAENQLREDLSDIYATIAGNFGPPTSSQMENVKMMETKLGEAKAKMDKSRNGSVKKYKAMLEKLELKAFSFESFEEFTDKE